MIEQIDTPLSIRTINSENKFLFKIEGNSSSLPYNGKLKKYKDKNDEKKFKDIITCYKLYLKN